jgi:hypothetical protein
MQLFPSIFLPAALLAFLPAAIVMGAETPAVVLPAVPQAMVDRAIAAPPFRCYRSAKHLQMISGSGGAGIALAVAAYQGNTSADLPLLQRIRFSLQGENAILAGGGYWAQHELQVTAMFTLAKLTPRVWNRLTPEERGKVDLLMKAALVASAFTTSDATYANGGKPVTLDGSSNLNRDWNPNYREGMLGTMIVGAIYYGGAAQTHQVLDTYDHDAFVAQLKAAGLTNPLETFIWKQTHPTSNAPDGKTLAAHIRDYRYKDLDLNDPMAWYYRLTINTYGAKVQAGLNGGKGIHGAGCLVSGAEQLPNQGKDGMLLEFDSKDAGGPRSSAEYAYGGFHPNLITHIVLLAGGYWKNGEQGDECLARMEVGITDLYYKLEHGYHDYSKGHAAARVFDLHRAWDFEMAHSLWQDVVEPWHQQAVARKP